MLHYSVAAHAHKHECMRGVTADSLANVSANDFTATMKAGFHILFRQIEGGSRFSGAEFFHITQHEHGTKVFREAENCLVDHARELPIRGLTLGLRRIGRDHDWSSVGKCLVHLLKPLAFASTRESLV